MTLRDEFFSYFFPQLALSPINGSNVPCATVNMCIPFRYLNHFSFTYTKGHRSACITLQHIGHPRAVSIIIIQIWSAEFDCPCCAIFTLDNFTLTKNTPNENRDCKKKHHTWSHSKLLYRASKTGNLDCVSAHKTVQMMLL